MAEPWTPEEEEQVRELHHGPCDVMVRCALATLDEERERVRRMRELLDSAVGNLDRHMPDGCGARAVLTSKIRDAIADKWDEGEWDEDEGYRRLTNTAR
jgi:hypothetical protein